MHITRESVSELSNSINQTLIPEYLVGDFNRTAIFIYSPDHNYRYFLYSHHVKVDPDVIVYPTIDDPVFVRALDFHKHGLCATFRSTNLPPESLMYKVITDWEEIEIDPEVYYFSCPIYMDGVLIGYVGSVISRSGNGLVEDLQLLRLLTAKIEVEFKEYLSHEH